MPFVVTSLKVNETVPSQASVAVGVVNTGRAGHSTELALGNALITGALLSVTLIVWEAIDELPHGSVAVHVLVTLYSWPQVPFVVTSLKVNETVPSQASVAVGVVNTGRAGHSTELALGNALITGE